MQQVKNVITIQDGEPPKCESLFLVKRTDSNVFCYKRRQRNRESEKAYLCVSVENFREKQVFLNILFIIGLKCGKESQKHDAKSAFKSTDEETRNVKIIGLNLRMEIKVEKVSVKRNLL